MKKLSEKKWKEFTLNEIFNIESGKRLEIRNQIEGNRPFVSAASINNGITNFVSNINGSLDKNVLGVNYEGEGGVAYSFYHPYKCLFSDAVKRFHLKEYEDNKYVLLFIKTLIFKQRSKYSYGYSFNSERMKRQYIMLPTNDREEPDYKYMENYMKSLEENKKASFLKSIEKKLCIIKYKNIKELDKKEWRAFKVGELFKIEKCKCSKTSLLSEGSIPYVGATNRNNGVMKFVKNDAKLISKGNCIVFICDGQGSVGKSIYKKENFIGSTTLKIGRNNQLNEFNSLFIINALDKNEGLYSYGYKRNEYRLKAEKIMLPVDDKKEPDYEYMEQYVKNHQRIMLEKYLELKNISALKAEVFEA